MNAKKISQIKSAFFSTIPVMAGYLVLGIGFGMILQARGYGVLWALAMSVFIYAGSMQYVAIDLLSGGVSLLDYLYWIAGSVIGSVLGSVLPFSTEGIDFSLTLMQKKEGITND